MWLLFKTAWRNLFRQRRRTAITTAAMAVGLTLVIPTGGLVGGLSAEMLRGITGLELGHVQIHDPAYPRGRALQSTLESPDLLTGALRAIPGVRAAAPRALGHALASRDVALAVEIVGLGPARAASLSASVRFGRALDPRAPWRRDPALACEALVSRADANRHGVAVGLILTPRARTGAACERIRVAGLTREPLPGESGTLVLAMEREDVVRAFGGERARAEAVLRQAAPVLLAGVEPAREREVTFLPEKVIAGRYLDAGERGAVVVGQRLAQTLRLAPGDRLFVQAASLDPAKGAFFGDLRVVGVFRTGVDLIDRARVFLSLEDARRLMALGDRAHEIAVRAESPEELKELVERMRAVAREHRLQVTAAPPRAIAGGRPLPAPVRVLPPGATGAALLVPYDLRARLEELPGLAATGPRVYGRIEVAAARRARVRLEPRPVPGCGALLSEAAARALGVGEGARVVLERGAGDEGCTELVVSKVHRSRGTRPVLFASAGAARDLTLLAPERADTLRFVGVDPALERRLGTFGADDRGASGPAAEPAAEDAPWPATLSARAARRLGVGRGAPLLLHTRAADGERRTRRAEVARVLPDAGWPADLPELVLPYEAAQQVEGDLLNGRAHELVLVPDARTTPAALARDASARMQPLVRSWREVAPTMARLLRFQEAYTAILLFVILAIASVAVMNTMLMAVFERTREFGVLKSIGMRPRQVFGIILFETLLIALLASALGGTAGFALDSWLASTGLDLSSFTSGFQYEGAFVSPIWKSVVTVRVVLFPVAMVAFLCLLVSFYPALRAARLRPVEALRHVG